jgi:predicted 3-demethylubiquinone-9 3-methyltransferase (glyoxalase superfamily)
LDKYGFSWQVVPDMSQWINGPDSAGSARAMQAMLGMKKIIIADLEKAYNG